MKIGVDLDNVVFNFQPFWGELYNHYFDKSVNVERLRDWDDLVEKTHFDTGHEFLEWFARADGWRKMPFERGAQGGIDELLAKGHVITFITARSGPAVEPTLEWHRNSPWSGKRETQLVVAREDKWSIPCSVYIDDSPKVLNGLVDAGKPTIIFDKPWNGIIPRPKPCEECAGSGSLPPLEPESKTERPCLFCRGTGDSTPLFRAKSWRDVVNLVERLDV